MRVRSLVAMGALGLALAAPAQAQQQKTDPFTQLEALLNSGLLLRGVVRDEDVTLLFAHARAALAASIEGREAPPLPEALQRRSEEITGDLKGRTALAGMLLLSALEEAVRQALREAFPSVPANIRAGSGALE